MLPSERAKAGHAWVRADGGDEGVQAGLGARDQGDDAVEAGRLFRLVLVARQVPLRAVLRNARREPDVRFPRLLEIMRHLDIITGLHWMLSSAASCHMETVWAHGMRTKEGCGQVA